MKNIMTISTAALLSLSASSFAANHFSVTSTDMSSDKPLTQQQVFNDFGCSGQNISPQLAWANAPEGTKSFAVTLYDPDAPTGSGWWHWTLVNLPATTTSLPAGAGDRQKPQLPAGAIQGRNDYGYAGFGGACPPPGAKPHRYQFTVWALNTDKLPLDNQSSGAMVGYMLNNAALAKAEMTVKFGQ